RRQSKAAEKKLSLRIEAMFFADRKQFSAIGPWAFTYLRCSRFRSALVYADVRASRCGRDLDVGLTAAASGLAFGLLYPAACPQHITWPSGLTRRNKRSLQFWPESRRAGPSRPATRPPFDTGPLCDSSEPECSIPSNTWPATRVYSAVCSRHYTSRMGGGAASAIRHHGSPAAPSPQAGQDLRCPCLAGARHVQSGDSAPAKDKGASSKPTVDLDKALEIVRARPFLSWHREMLPSRKSRPACGGRAQSLG